MALIFPAVIKPLQRCSETQKSLEMSVSIHAVSIEQPCGKNTIPDKSLSGELVASPLYATNAHNSTNW